MSSHCTVITVPCYISKKQFESRSTSVVHYYIIFCMIRQFYYAFCFSWKRCISRICTATNSAKKSGNTAALKYVHVCQKLKTVQCVIRMHVAECRNSITGWSSKAQYTPPTLTRRNCRVASRQWCVHEFATSSRRLPTDSAITYCCHKSTNLSSKSSDQTDSMHFTYFYTCIREFFYNFFNNDVITSSLSTGNCKLLTGVFIPLTRRNSKVSSRRRRQCVLGIKASAHLSNDDVNYLKYKVIF